MRRLTILVAAIMLVATFSVQPASASVVVKGTSGNRWKPNSVSVATGTKVVWKAVTGSHTVTAYKGNWSKNTTIAQGTSTSFTFKSTGVYKFRCRFHSSVVNGKCSGMCGKVVVG